MDLDRPSVWEEEPAAAPRLPDPVRAAAVRAVLIAALALVQALFALVLAVGHSWLAAPMLLLTVLTCVVGTWAVLDVWVTRQVWNQRNGVLSSPSSVARARRRERRAARRAAARAPARGRAHIPRVHGV